MIFTADTDVTLAHTAALVNTAPGHGVSGVEDLPDAPALAAWMDAWQWTGRRPEADSEAADVRALRPRLRRLWSLAEGDLVTEVNALLAEGQALPRLVTHAPLGWHVHATSDDAPLAQRIIVEVGMALIDVIRTGELARLKVCEGEGCEDVLVDLSKNRSRRYCEGTCATRAHVAAYRARKAAR